MNVVAALEAGGLAVTILGLFHSRHKARASVLVALSVLAASVVVVPATVWATPLAHSANATIGGPLPWHGDGWACCQQSGFDGHHTFVQQQGVCLFISARPGLAATEDSQLRYGVPVLSTYGSTDFWNGTTNCGNQQYKVPPGFLYIAQRLDYFITGANGGQGAWAVCNDGPPIGNPVQAHSVSTSYGWQPDPPCWDYTSGAQYTWFTFQSWVTDSNHDGYGIWVWGDAGGITIYPNP